MRLGEVADLLIQIADRGGGFGSDAERSLRALAAALMQRSNDDVADLQKAIAPKAVRAKKAVAAIRDELVDAYFSALSEAPSLENGEEVLAKLVADKAAKKGETVAIAQLFTGSTAAYKTKAIAQSSIRDHLRRKAWDQGALDIIKSRTHR